MKKNFKSIIISTLCIVFILYLTLTGCAKDESSSSPSVSAAPAPTPSAETVTTVSDVRITEIGSDVHVPDFYTQIHVNGIEDTLYAFVDEEGEYQYRVYGERDSIENDVVVDTVTGFFDADIRVVGDNSFSFAEEAKKYLAEGMGYEDAMAFAQQEADKISEKYDDPVFELVFGKDISVVDVSGDIPGSASIAEVPVPESSAGEGEVDGNVFRVPENYVEVEGKPGLYSYNDVLGNTVYRAYGAYDGNDAAFWMANEDGSMVSGGFMIDTYMEKELADAYSAVQSQIGEEAADIPDAVTYILVTAEDGRLYSAYIAGPGVDAPVQPETAQDPDAPQPVENNPGVRDSSAGSNNSGKSDMSNQGSSGSGNSGGGSVSGNASGNSSGSVSENSGSGSAAKPVPEPTTSGHYEKVWIVDSPAYEKDVYETRTVIVCLNCGNKSYTSNDAYIHADSHLIKGENDAYSSKKEEIKVGTETIPEKGHWENVWIED